MSDLDRYLDHLYGDRQFYIQFCTLNGDTGAWIEGTPQAYSRHDRGWLKRKIEHATAAGLNAYVSAHGYRDNRRGGVSANAAPIDNLWVEADEAPLPTGDIRPTMRVETSPGREHWYIKLTRAVSPEVAVDLNRRYAHMVGADSGHHLTKRLRPPDTINYDPKKRPGVHQVRLLEVDDSRALDPDELDQILPRLPPAPKINLSAIATDTDDEPPIVLPPDAEAVWRGLSPAKKPNGEIDRSRSLLKIGAVLHEYGANERLIVAELATRDMSLGFNKYTGHPEEYVRIARKVADKPRKIGSTGQPYRATADCADPADGDSCDIRLARTIAELDQVRAERDELGQTVDRLRVRIKLADQRLATYQNPGLGSAKAVASGLIQIFAAETPAKPESQTGYRVPLGKLADMTGLSEDACSRQIKQLAKYTVSDSDTPIIHYNVASVGGLDRETGEIIAPHKEMWIGPGVDVNQFAEVVATLKPAEKPKWGGVTNDGTCADHPHDGVVERVRYQKTVTYECSVCNHVLSEETSPVASNRAKVRHLPRIPTPHDAAQHSVTDSDLPAMPQDANSINPTTEYVVSNYPGKMRHKAELPPAPLFAPLTTEEMAAGLATYSKGMKPTPLDHYTDIAQGTKP